MSYVVLTALFLCGCSFNHVITSPLIIHCLLRSSHPHLRLPFPFPFSPFSLSLLHVPLSYFLSSTLHRLYALHIRLDENKSARRTCITMTAIMVIFPLVTFLIAYILLADQGSQRVIYSGAWGVGAVNVVMVAFVFYALCIDKDERPMDVWPSQMQGDNANKDKKER